MILWICPNGSMGLQIFVSDPAYRPRIRVANAIYAGRGWIWPNGRRRASGTPSTQNV